MDTGSAFDALIAERSRRPRGADEVYRRAAGTPTLGAPPSRWAWRVGAAAAVAALVIGVAGIIGTTRGNQEVVADHAAGGRGGGDQTGPMSTPEVLGVVNPPPGFELVSAVDTGTPSVWTGPAGELTVFQQLSSDGRRAPRVLAIATTHSDEHTVLDAVGPGPDQTTTVPIGGLEVTFARAETEGRSISTYGSFDLARWRAPDGATVTVASRGLDDDELRTVVADLIGGTEAADLATTSSTVASMDRVAADPRRVPSRPAFSAARQVFESAAGEQVTVGTELGTWPAAADLLWWAADGELVADGRLKLADGLVYQASPGGAATAAGSSGVADELLGDVLRDVVGLSRADWRAIAGELEQSGDQEVATTEVPQGE